MRKGLNVPIVRPEIVPSFYLFYSSLILMSGSVWYLSFRKKKIEFKRYPGKKKSKKLKKNKSGKTKSLMIFLMFSLGIIFFLNLISAAPINDTLHLNLQTTFSNGTIETGTFTFGFNLTESSSASCLGPVVYNHSTSLATDNRGIVSITLPTSGSGGGNLSTLSFDKQYYLCYYRDGSLKDVTQIGRVPYSFRATQVNLSEISVDSNLTLGSFNVSGSSGFFSFLGSLANRVTSLFVQDINASGDINFTGLIYGNGSQLTGITADNSNTLDGFDSTFFMPLNTSVYGDFDFNGGWTGGGASIVGGDGYFQTLFVFNLTSLNVTQQNLSIVDDLIVFGNTELKQNLTVDTDTLFVDSSTNRVGIGTTSPDRKLHVNSGTTNIAAVFESTDDEGGISLMDNGTTDDTNVLLLADDNDLVMWAGASERLRILSGGNVGIGTDSPSTALHIDNPTFDNHLNISRSGQGSYSMTLSSNKLIFIDKDGNQNVAFDDAGNVGINTTTPQNTLNVVGDLNVTGFSITDDSLISMADGSKKKIKDIKAGEEVLSLDEKTGKIVSNKVQALLDHGIKPIYEMTTESGKSINTTAEHPYYLKSFVKEGYILNAKGEIINNLPLNSGGLTFSNNFDKSEKVVSIKGGVIFNTTIPKYSLGGNSLLLRKCLSNVNIIRDSDLAILDNCLSVEPRGTFLISCFCFINNSVTSFGKFSSERNFNLFLEENMFFFPDEFRSICHNGKDSKLCERWKIILKNLINADTCSEQFQNLPDHDPCSYKSRSSSADFTVSDDVIINFNPHVGSNDNVVFKDYDNSDELGTWIEVQYLKVGDEIAVPDYSTGTIKWEKITSINTLEPQHVYDLAIEGTRNFIANDIVAHNTYIDGVNVTGDFVPYTGADKNVDLGANNLSVDTNVLFVDSNNDGVGIGTVSPIGKLSIVGTDDESAYLNFMVGGGNRLIFSSNNTAPAKNIIRVANSYDLEFQDDTGANILYLDESNGNVGIGTVSPGSKFHIDAGQSSTAVFEGSGNVFTEFWNDDITAALLWGDDDGSAVDLRFGTVTSLGDAGGFTERMRIDSSGNVGIGTTSPDKALDVSANAGNAVGTVAIFQNTGASSADTGARIVLGAIGGDEGVGIGALAQDASGTGKADMGFYTSDGAGLVQLMTLDRVGNLGIGTASPGAILDVNASAAARFSTDGNFQLILSPRVAQGMGINYIQAASSGKYNWFAGAQFNVNNAFEITPSTALDGSTFSTPNLVILQSGNVGIGTVSPGRLLTLKKDGSAASIGIDIHNEGTNAADDSIIAFETQGQRDFVIGIDRTDGFFHFDNADALDGTSAMTIDGSGNVGIGTTSPETNLDVNIGSDGVHGIVLNSDDANNQSARLLFSNSNDQANAFSIFKRHVSGTPTLAFAYNANVGSTSGTTALTIEDGGNVGIGTDSPSTALTIKPANAEGFELQESDSTIESLRLESYNSGAVFQMFRDGVENIHMDSTGSGDVWFNNDGNVGIGTTSPAGALEILHSSGETLILNKTTTEPTLKFIGDAGNDFTITIAGTNLRVANDDGTTSLLEIEQGGNVGIGDTNPDVLLHVTGGLGVDGALILEATGASSGFTTQQVQIRADSRDTNGGQLIFSTDTTGGVLTDAMTISREQKVGIGTSSPGGKLEISDNVSGTSDTLILNNPHVSGTQTRLNFEQQSVTKWIQYLDHATNDLRFFDSGGDNRLSIEFGTGNVGIGTTSPEAKLNVVVASAGAVAPNAAADDFVLEMSASGGMSILGADATDMMIAFGTPSNALGAFINYDYDIAGGSKLQLSNNNASGKMEFLTGGNVLAMIIDGSQNVGIGTASPDTKLHVYDTKGTSALKVDWIEENSNTSDVLSSIEFGTPTGENAAGAQAVSAYIKSVFTRSGCSGGGCSYEDAGLTFGTLSSSDSSVTERLRITDSGLVGINTTGPSSTLEVTGNLETTNLYDNDASNFFDGGCSADQYISGIDSTGAITCAGDSGTGTMSSWTIAGDSGSETVSNGQTATIAGSGTIDTTESGTRTVVVSVQANSIGDSQLAFDTGQTLTTSGTPAFSTLSLTGTGTALTVAGDISLSGDEDIIQFASDVGNKINLWGTTYGLGIQSGELVTFAPAGSDFRWRDAVLGTTKMELDVTTGNLQIDGDLDLDGGNLYDSGTTNFFGTSGCGANTGVSSMSSAGTITCTADSASDNYGSWTLTGDSGTPETINSGNTVDIAGGTAISTVVGATDTVTVSVTAGSIGDTQLAFDTGQALTTTSNVQFDIFSIGSSATSLNSTNTNGYIDVDADEYGLIIEAGFDSPDEPARLLITTDADGTDDIAIEVRGEATGSAIHNPTWGTGVASTSSRFVVFGNGNTVIGKTSVGDNYGMTQSSMLEVNGLIYASGDLDVGGGDIFDDGTAWLSTSGCSQDTYVSGVASDGTITCSADTGHTSSMSFTLAGTSGSSQTITQGNTLLIAAGNAITTTGAATDKVTIAVAALSIDDAEIVQESIDGSEIANDAISNTELAANSVDLTSDALSTAYAGSGIGGGGTAALNIGAGNCITIGTDTVGVGSLCIDDAEIVQGSIDSTELATNSVAADEFNAGDASLENEVEGMIFDSDAQSITGVWEVQNDINFQFGNAADWAFNFDDSVDDQLLLTTILTTAIADTDPMFEILVPSAVDANQQIFGIAKGTQASNTEIFWIDEDGDAVFGGANGKIDALTYDPVYTINNITYATYLPSMAGGVKEEVTGTVMLNSDYAIDFNNLEIGSDLWLFYQVTDFGNEMENLQVILTPSFNGNVWYEKNPTGNTLKISGDQSGEVSYRFTANRFDWKKWDGNHYVGGDTVKGVILEGK